MEQEVIVSVEEQKAIIALKRLAKKWPNTLSLFSWSGSLCVMKRAEDGRLVDVGSITGIDNDGGDPSSDEVDQYALVIRA